MTKFSGELPDELIEIVRDYSKPLFRFPKEYKEVLSFSRRKEWSALKEKLSGENAARVSSAAQNYIDACLERKRASDADNAYRYYMPKDMQELQDRRVEQRRLHKEYLRAERVQSKMYDDLILVVSE